MHNCMYRLAHRKKIERIAQSPFWTNENGCFSVHDSSSHSPLARQNTISPGGSLLGIGSPGTQRNSGEGSMKNGSLLSSHSLLARPNVTSPGNGLLGIGSVIMLNR